MRRVVVSQAKFDEACRLYGYKSAKSILAVEGRCAHDWFLDVNSGENMLGQLVYAQAFLQCRYCEMTRDTLNLLD